MSYKILAAISYLILLKGPLNNTSLDRYVFNINYLGVLLKVECDYYIDWKLMYNFIHFLKEGGGL